MTTRGFVAGIDPSEVMLRQASRRNRDYIREERVQLKLASMSAIPYPDSCFDKVFGTNSIQFPRDLLPIWARFAGYCGPEGWPPSRYSLRGKGNRYYRHGNWEQFQRCDERRRFRWMQNRAEARLPTNTICVLGQR